LQSAWTGRARAWPQTSVSTSPIAQETGKNRMPAPKRDRAEARQRHRRQLSGAERAARFQLRGGELTIVLWRHSIGSIVVFRKSV
jgi:hypothetical protein